MTAVTLTARQVRYVNRAFWRNPAQAFFIFAFPLLFLVIFTALLGDNSVRLGQRTVRESAYYVAAMATFGLVTASFNNIAIGMTFQREAGVLKRVAGTPLPSAAFLGARVVHAILMAAALVAITAGFGRVAYDVPLPSGRALGELIVMLAVGAGAFCALGLAVTALVPNADAAAPIVNAIILPLLFLSGIFIAFGDQTPGWVLWVARIFPIRHFATAMQAAFLGTSFAWTDVAVVAGWGIAGLLLAVRFFRWEPS